MSEEDIRPNPMILLGLLRLRRGGWALQSARPTQAPDRSPPTTRHRRPTLWRRRQTRQPQRGVPQVQNQTVPRYTNLNTLSLHDALPICILGLNQIKYLGDIFGNNSKNRTRSEIIVFIRPKVIRNALDAQSSASGSKPCAHPPPSSRAATSPPRKALPTSDECQRP